MTNETNNPRTHVLLDVDGVINAVHPSDTEKRLARHSGEWLEGYAREYLITWNTDVVDFLNDLFTKTNLVVLSTWRRGTLEEIFPLVGLEIPPYEVLVLDEDEDISSYQEDVDYTTWWKLKFAKEYISEIPAGDKVVWIDDDLKYVRPALDHIGVLNKDGRVVLPISPQTRTGLDADDIERISSFITM